MDDLTDDEGIGSSSSGTSQLKTAEGKDGKTADDKAKAGSKKKTVKDMMSPSISLLMSTQWDPLVSDSTTFKPSHHCLMRIKRDLQAIYNEPPPGMFVAPDDDDMTLIHALITGPFDTPYEGGFFYFILRCPSEYPLKPPRARLMNTGGGTVRFNPNLYQNGKVCLSILGTWSGPAWSPAQSLSSVVISIQSLMNENPYHNEPGYEGDGNKGASDEYNNIIRHETIRVAVCEMLEAPSAKYKPGQRYSSGVPDCLHEPLEEAFLEFYEYYKQAVKSKQHLDGKVMMDPFGDRRGKFCFKELEERLTKIYVNLTKKREEKE